MDTDKNWIYFPESDVPFYRVTYLSNYSPYLTAEPGQFSLLTETSTSTFKPEDAETIVDRVVDGLVTTGLLEEDDRSRIVARWRCSPRMTYPVPSVGRDAALGTIQPWLRSQQIWSRGRFGGWLYEIGNMDHSAMQGVEWVDHVLSGEPGDRLDSARRGRRRRGDPVGGAASRPPARTPWHLSEDRDVIVSPGGSGEIYCLAVVDPLPGLPRAAAVPVPLPAQARVPRDGTFANPVLDTGPGRDHGDPFVLRHAGRYYLYYTGSSGIEVWTGTDLTDWTRAGHALAGDADGEAATAPGRPGVRPGGAVLARRAVGARRPGAPGRGCGRAPR